MYLAKRTLYAGTRRLGVNALLRRASRERLLVLCYHGVISEGHTDDPLRTRNAVNLFAFRKQLSILCRFFSPISATDILMYMQGTASLPDYPALVTFDDGYRNNLTFAAPELKRQGVPAIFHVATGYVGQDRLLWPHELDERILGWQYETLPMPESRPDIPLTATNVSRVELAHQIRDICKAISNTERESYLDRLRNGPLSNEEDWHRELYAFASWDEIRKLSALGFEIGSHTVNHPIMTRLSHAQIDFELRESKATVECELGKACPWLAYPNGGPSDVSPEVYAVAKEVGYSIAFTAMGQLNSSKLSSLEIDRTCVAGGLSENVFHAMISGLHARLRPVR